MKGREGRRGRGGLPNLEKKGWKVRNILLSCRESLLWVAVDPCSLYMNKAMISKSSRPKRVNSYSSVLYSLFLMTPKRHYTLPYISPLETFKCRYLLYLHTRYSFLRALHERLYTSVRNSTFPTSPTLLSAGICPSLPSLPPFPGAECEFYR